MSKILLDAKNITKSFSNVKVLDEVSLSVNYGEIHALVGENGAGKSTLMKIITGVEKADKGNILFKDEPLIIHHPKEIQKLGIGIVYQEFNLLPDLTVAQNLFIGREPDGNIFGFIDNKKINFETAKILSALHSNISPTTLVKELSVAEQQILEIAKSLSYNCDLIIMDEPTAALTDTEIKVLFNIIAELNEKGVSFIYISHRMSDLDAIAQSVSVLRDGKLVSTRKYSSEIKDTLIQEMVGRELTQKFPTKPNYKKSEKILSVRNLNVPNTLTDINFDLYKGEILGISGLMGAGRTEMAKAIIGALHSSSKDVIINGESKKINSPKQANTFGIGYLTEDRKRDGLLLNLSLKENVAISNYDRFLKFGFVVENKLRKSIDNFINILNIKTTGGEQIVANLSGGNQQKVVLAKLLNSESKILILDEPTRGIDVGAKYEIYELIYELVKKDIAVMIISSEFPEILGICDRILVMSNGKISGVLDPKTTDQSELLNYSMGRI